MKFNKILTIFALAGTLMLAACGGSKPDEAALADLSKFEGDWMAAVESMKTASADVKKAMEMSMSNTDSACNGECKKDMKGTCDSLKMSCKSIQEKMGAMAKTADEKIAAAEADGKKWAEWSEKVKKGEVKVEDLKKGMDEWNGKVGMINADLGQWKTELDELSKNCMSNCDGMKGCCETKASDKK